MRNRDFFVDDFFNHVRDEFAHHTHDGGEWGLSGIWRLVDTGNFFGPASAGASLTTGDYNTAGGVDALATITTQSTNTAFGYGAGKTKTGGGNCWFGVKAGGAGTLGDYNIGIGFETLYSTNNSNCLDNVAIAYRAGYNITEGYNNIYIGKEVGLLTTTGRENVAIGYSALGQNQTNDQNTALGCFAGKYVRADNTVAVGFNALVGKVGNKTTGAGNVAIGVDAGSEIVGASSGNVFLGYQAGPATSAAYTDEGYFDNHQTDTPLMHHDYSGHVVTINGDLTVTGTSTPGTLEHHDLNGLADDDHTQYLLADGSRALSADWDIGNGRKIQADRIEARDSDGLKLYEDGGNGIDILDAGNILIQPGGNSVYLFNSSVAGDGSVVLDHNITKASGNWRGFRDESIFRGSGGGQAYAVFDAAAWLYDAYSYDHIAAFQSRPILYGTASVSHIYNFYTLCDVRGTATNVYGVYVSDPANTGTITNNYGIIVSELTRGSNNYAIYTSGATKSYFGGNVGIGTSGPDRKLDVLDASNPQIRATHTDGSVYTDFQTDANGDLTITPSGDEIILPDGKNITVNTTTGTKIGTATSQKLGFFNASPVVQPTALTAQLTTITYTAPGTPDYALQDVTNSSPWGFADAEEARTFISVVKNLQDRVSELETKLQSLGLLA